MSAPVDDDRIVVVGSGPCGAMAARELVLAGARVTMLEAGARLPRGIIVRAAGRTVVRWRSPEHLSTDRHVAAGDPETEWYSSLSPGGLSNYWTAAVPRFAPQDFTDGARFDERFDWPVRYGELVPFYEVAEEVLCITGPPRSVGVLPRGRSHARVALPADWEGMARAQSPRALVSIPLARGRRWMWAWRGSEFNSYHVIVAPLHSSDHFELRLGALVTRLLVDSDGRCIGVEQRDVATGRTEQLRAKAVVVAAGAIDSTRVLLNSTGPSAPTGLGNEHGLVGRYLHDHPREWWQAAFSRPVTLLDHPAYLGRAPYESSPPLSGASATIGLAVSRDRLVALRGGRGPRVGVQVLGTMVPTEDGTVRLLDREDAVGMRQVELTLRYDDRALSTLADERARFVDTFAAAGNVPHVLPEQWRPRPGNSVHYGGTVRMHDRAEFGVLDRWNRVRSTPNVIVVDSSCFPTNPEKNPTLTAMALAARAARRLARDTA